jgi:hypothetical protein
MTTENVLRWIKSLSAKADNYYCGMLNAKKEKSFGVYQLKDSRARDIALGNQTQTGTKGISVLVHWTTSTRETENIAAELYKNLAEATDINIGGNKVNYIQLLHNESIDVGMDENGVCERVIEFVIYYERS